MIKTYNLTVNIKVQKTIPRIECVKGDTNSYELNINLIDGTLPMDLTNQTARLVCRKHDGTTVFQDFTIVNALSGNISTVLSTQSIACLGNVIAEIKIYGLNTELLTSVRFSYTVVDSLLTEDTVVSTNEFSALTTALGTIDAMDNRVDGVDVQLAKTTSEIAAFAKALDTTNLTVALKSNIIDVNAQIASLVGVAPKEAYATLALLQTAHPVDDGNLYVVTANGNLYDWVSGTWADTGFQYQGIVLADGSVVAKQINQTSATGNLFDQTKATDGYVIDSTTGLPVVNVAYSITDHIPVIVGKSYRASNLYHYAWYDSGKVYISGVSITTGLVGIITAPTNSAYVRLSMYPAHKTAYMIVDNVIIPSDYIPSRASSIGWLSITANNLNKGTVTLDKTSIAKPKKNLFNPLDALDNYYVKDTDGRIAANTSYMVSGFMPVEPLTAYIRRSNQRIAFYDINGVFIIGLVTSPTNLIVTTPANCYWARVSLIKVSGDTLGNYQFEKGGIQTTYEPYKLVVSKDYMEVVEITDKSITTNKLEVTINAKNLYKEYPDGAGNYVNWTNGVLAVNVAYNSSDFIPVNPSEPYTRSYASHYAWYDVNKVFISGESGGAVTLTAPSNAHYIRVSVRVIDLKYQLEKGSTATLYEPYGFYLDGLLGIIQTTTDSPTTVNDIINLPSTLPILVGEELSVYFDNVTNNAKNFDFDVTATEGIQKDKRYVHTFTGAKTITLSIAKYKDAIIQLTKSTSIIAKDISENTSNFTALFIGDSTTDDGGFGGKSTEKVLELFTADTYSDITLIGTRGVGLDKHEGRSGWTLALYTGSASLLGIDNAFWNPTTSSFDFAYYMAQTSFATPTHVFVNLGINDMFNFTSDEALMTGISTVLTNFDKVKNSIKAFNSTIKVCIAATIPPNGSQDDFGDSYTAGQVRWRYKRNNEIFVNELLKKYDNRTVEGIYIVPINLGLDTMVDFANGVHPNSVGYDKIGEDYYRFLKVLG